jgi:hypothetical protein
VQVPLVYSEQAHFGVRVLYADFGQMRKVALPLPLPTIEPGIPGALPPLGPISRCHISPLDLTLAAGQVRISLALDVL